MGRTISIKDGTAFGTDLAHCSIPSSLKNRAEPLPVCTYDLIAWYLALNRCLDSHFTNSKAKSCS